MCSEIQIVGIWGNIDAIFIEVENLGASEPKWVMGVNPLRPGGHHLMIENIKILYHFWDQWFDLILRFKALSTCY